MVQKCKPQKKDSQIISFFLHFWGLQVKKLLVKRWWNGPEVTLKNTWLKDKTKLLKVYGLEMETYIFTPKAT